MLLQLWIDLDGAQFTNVQDQFMCLQEELLSDHIFCPFAPFCQSGPVLENVTSDAHRLQKQGRKCGGWQTATSDQLAEDQGPPHREVCQLSSLSHRTCSGPTGPTTCLWSPRVPACSPPFLSHQSWACSDADLPAWRLLLQWGREGTPFAGS